MRELSIKGRLLTSWGQGLCPVQNTIWDDEPYWFAEDWEVLLRTEKSKKDTRLSVLKLKVSQANQDKSIILLLKKASKRDSKKMNVYMNDVSRKYLLILSSTIFQVPYMHYHNKGLS